MKQIQALLCLFGGAVLALVACSMNDAAAPKSASDDTAPSANETGSLPCDVDDVLARRCRQCHSSPPDFGAPMPLVTLADTHSAAHSDASKHVYEKMGERIHDDAHPMPQAPNARLDAKDTTTLDAWIRAGAPAGDGTATCAPAKPPPDTTPLSCTPDVHMAPASPYAMPSDADDRYICYGFDVQVATPGKRHLIAIAPKIQNPKIVHHLVLFQTPATVDPTPNGCDFGSMSKWRLIYGWAPGSQPLELPPEAGYPQEGVAHYVVQMHYSNPQHLAAQTDASGFDFCTTDRLRPNDADAVLFGDESFTIPPRGTLTRQCDYKWPADLPSIHVFAALPHMHQLGTWIRSTITPASSPTPADFGARDPWDFQNQIYVPLNVMVNPGDLLRTTCKWTNPQDTPVSFGAYTSDEMCNSYTLYYPKIVTPGWTWTAPVDHGTCATVP